MKYRSSSEKIQEFEKQILSISDRKTKTSYLMTETLLVQNEAYVHDVFLEREWFLLSVLGNLSYE